MQFSDQFYNKHNQLCVVISDDFTNKFQNYYCFLNSTKGTHTFSLKKPTITQQNNNIIVNNLTNISDFQLGIQNISINENNELTFAKNYYDVRQSNIILQNQNHLISFVYQSPQYANNETDYVVKTVKKRYKFCPYTVEYSGTLNNVVVNGSFTTKVLIKELDENNNDNEVEIKHFNLNEIITLKSEYYFWDKKDQYMKKEQFSNLINNLNNCGLNLTITHGNIDKNYTNATLYYLTCNNFFNYTIIGVKSIVDKSNLYNNDTYVYELYSSDQFSHQRIYKVTGEPIGITYSRPIDVSPNYIQQNTPELTVLNSQFILTRKYTIYHEVLYKNEEKILDNIWSEQNSTTISDVLYYGADNFSEDDKNLTSDIIYSNTIYEDNKDKVLFYGENVVKKYDDYVTGYDEDKDSFIYTKLPAVFSGWYLQTWSAVDLQNTEYINPQLLSLNNITMYSVNNSQRSNFNKIIEILIEINTDFIFNGTITENNITQNIQNNEIKHTILLKIFGIQLQNSNNYIYNAFCFVNNSNNFEYNNFIVCNIQVQESTIKNNSIKLKLKTENNELQQDFSCQLTSQAIVKFTLPNTITAKEFEQSLYTSNEKTYGLNSILHTGKYSSESSDSNSSIVDYPIIDSSESSDSNSSIVDPYTNYYYAKSKRTNIKTVLLIENEQEIINGNYQTNGMKFQILKRLKDSQLNKFFNL